MPVIAAHSHRLGTAKVNVINKREAANNMINCFQQIVSVKYRLECRKRMKSRNKYAANVEKLAAWSPINFTQAMFTPKFKIAAKIVVAKLRAVSFEIWYPIPKKLHNALKEAPKYRNPVYFHASLNEL